MYAPLWYEVRFPCPALDWDFTLEGDRRIDEARSEVAAMVRRTMWRMPPFRR